MFVKRVGRVRQHLQEFVEKRFQTKLEFLIVESPPQVELGDLAFPFPFELAKILRRSPRSIADEVVELISPLLEVDRFEAAGGGYVNVFFNRESFLKDLDAWLVGSVVETGSGKVIVEHTNINPNKAAHIGHLRNAILGDSFVRLMRSLGRQVEVQNYIDNTGVQVADVVVGFTELLNMSLSEIRNIDGAFDYFCWDLYARVSNWYGEESSRLQYRSKILKAIEEGQDEVAELAEHISTRIVYAHLKTMLRIGVCYDVLPRESEILALKFWDQAFKQLRKSKAIIFRENGAHAGCWVMELPKEEGLPSDEKIIVRSNGTVTYVGKDIAYQLWKFGLLGKTFHFKPFQTDESAHQTWVTTREDLNYQPSEFGNGVLVYNVIDVRQSYLQRVVVQGLRRLGYNSEAARSIHFSYEMVALSQACCSELGMNLSSEDKKRAYVEVSGRKGQGVKADDLIDKLIEKSLFEVKQRQPKLAQDQIEQISGQIAIGALRYFLLKYTRNTVIAFDFSEALSFEGETGPYLQYSVVRANNIFRKLVGQEEEWKQLRLQLQKKGKLKQVEGILADNHVWKLLLTIGKLEEVMQKSVETLEMSHIAKHAFLIAQQFNLFYHNYHILSEKKQKRIILLQIADNSRQALTKILEILGIEIPQKM